MHPERWQQIERLYHEALTRPVDARDAFLADACGGDETLLHEVLSLLAQPTSADRWLGVTIEPHLAMLASNRESGSLTGRRLGAYDVQERIGAGGMGEVYRARDGRLGRDVAIKVLPPAFADDRDRLGRFEREARVLAALNHPHIAAIYGFEDTPEARGLVLELVEGPTLADRVAVGALALPEALAIALQIAEALEAAHAKGIIHRDLKPANIKVTTEGVVKILDFGLAKVWAADTAAQELSHSPTITVAGTRDGTLLGTAAYMSPEQARGKAVDTRTDVWAFGCVLFEMLTARPAFAADTLSDTLARILEREPDWQRLPRSTPARLRNLLRRCLEKDPDARTAGLGEARRDIEACLASPFKVPRAILESLRWTLSRPAVRWSVVVLATSAIGATIYYVRDREAPLPVLGNPQQVTNASAVEDYPSWSPDGRTLAYESNETENWDIWLAQAGGGPAVNRTADYAGSDRYPSWSPDGRQIAFWSDREGGGYYVMPSLGGSPRRLAAASDLEWMYSPPAWAPDGSQLAVVQRRLTGNQREVYADLISLATRDVRELLLGGKEISRMDLQWSPDGRFLSYVDASTQLGEIGQLYVARVADGTAAAMTDATSNIRSPRWSRDSRSLFFVSNRVGPMDWWRQRIGNTGNAVGDPERVTTALEVANGSFSADATRLAYSKGRWVSNIWRFPILTNRPATWADAEQVTFEQAFIEFFDVSPDGREVVFSSDRSGNQDLWRMTIGGKQATQLTAGRVPDWNPVWSPDGRRLAFYSYRSGNRDLWTMPADGGAATQLTRTPELEAGPVWSPDGRAIAYRSERTGDSEIWVIDADGTGERQLTSDRATNAGAIWSPDGQWLAFYSTQAGQSQIWRIPAAGGAADQLTQRGGVSPLWSVDGRQIFFIGQEQRAGDFFVLSLADRSERPMTSLTGKRGTIGLQYPRTDGKFVYFTWRDDLGDIWTMDVAQN